LAYEFHIPPSALLAESPRMLVTLQRYLRWRNVQERQAQKGGK
jgi:hypothetical protein